MTIAVPTIQYPRAEALWGSQPDLQQPGIWNVDRLHDDHENHVALIRVIGDFANALRFDMPYDGDEAQLLAHRTWLILSRLESDSQTAMSRDTFEAAALRYNDDPGVREMLNNLNRGLATYLSAALMFYARANL